MKHPRTYPRTLVMLFLTAALIGSAATGSADHHDDGPHPQHDYDADRVPGLGDGFDGPGDDGPSKRSRRHRMSDDEAAAARAIVLRLYPELTEQLEELEARDPEEFRRTIERRFPRVRFLVKMQEKDPEMFELRMTDITLGRQIKALAEQVRQAHLDDDKDTYKDLREQLEDKVADHFEARQAIRELEIQMLERRIEELKERLEEHDDERDDLIEHRVEELTGPEW